MTAPHPTPPARPAPPRPQTVCPLPAVATRVVYPLRASVGVQRRHTTEFPFCRLHDFTVSKIADRHAAEPADVDVELRVMRTDLAPGQTLIGCAAAAPALDTVAGCDRPRVQARLGATMGGIDALVDLTLTAAGNTCHLGNEEQALTALLQAAEYLEAQVGVVARRLAARAGWGAVASAACREVGDATQAARLWSDGTLDRPAASA